MASTSRWAVDEDESTAIATQRKREKEEKKRLKEAKLQKAEAEKLETNGSNSSILRDGGEPPNKRRKTESESENPNAFEGANLLTFPTTLISPSRTVSLYEILNNIEEGSYGMVTRARLKETGEIVALKRLKLDYSNEGFPVTGLREIQTLKACSHTNIVSLREVVTSDNLQDVYLSMEFVEHDLKSLLEDLSEPFLPSETKTLMLQIVSATEYLHSHWILHRDLKTSNLLLNNRGEIKLADFGMARYTANPAPRLTQLVVTLWYRAPELLLGTEEYGFAIDVWSIGCVFAELLTREPLFQGKNEVGQLSAIFDTVGLPTNESWPGFRSLPNAKALHPILKASPQKPPSGLSSAKFPYLSSSGLRLLSSLLSLNPDNRPSAADVLTHAYFREDPRPKAKEMFPTFPSRAGQEKRRRKATPQAPGRGEKAPRLEADDFANVAVGMGMFARQNDEVAGAGFALRMG